MISLIIISFISLIRQNMQFIWKPKVTFQITFGESAVQKPKVYKFVLFKAEKSRKCLIIQF